MTSTSTSLSTKDNTKKINNRTVYVLSEGGVSNDKGKYLSSSSLSRIFGLFGLSKLDQLYLLQKNTIYLNTSSKTESELIAGDIVIYYDSLKKLYVTIETDLLSISVMYSVMDKRGSRIAFKFARQDYLQIREEDKSEYAKKSGFFKLIVDESV